MDHTKSNGELPHTRALEPGSFSVFPNWLVQDLLVAEMSRNELRVLFALLHRARKWSDGRWMVVASRTQLADDAGLLCYRQSDGEPYANTKAITRAISRLESHGAVSLHEQGRGPGHASTYEVNFKQPGAQAPPVVMSTGGAGATGTGGVGAPGTGGAGARNRGRGRLPVKTETKKLQQQTPAAAAAPPPAARAGRAEERPADIAGRLHPPPGDPPTVQRTRAFLERQSVVEGPSVEDIDAWIAERSDADLERMVRTLIADMPDAWVRKFAHRNPRSSPPLKAELHERFSSGRMVAAVG
ncbi:MAG: hypothetical protein ACF8PN_06810 [Phycisphaerales bacterium]